MKINNKQEFLEARKLSNSLFGANGAAIDKDKLKELQLAIHEYRINKKYVNTI